MFTENMSQKIYEIARSIDQTILSPIATADDINEFCIRSKEFPFFSVCVPPVYISQTVKHFKDTKTIVSTVIGFPFGYSTGEQKRHEVEEALELGAREVDMVMNIGAFISGAYGIVEAEIQNIVQISQPYVVKVILEEAYLNAEQIKIASEMIEHAGAQFVKTSTGFAPHGATVETVKLIKKNVSENMGIKAAGGIKDYQTYIDMIQAGATRIGTSRGIEIIKEAQKSMQ